MLTKLFQMKASFSMVGDNIFTGILNAGLVSKKNLFRGKGFF